MKLIDTEMAAVMLGCSRSHIHNLVNDGILTNYGKKKPWRLAYEEICQAVDDGRIVVAPKQNPRDGCNRPGA